MAIAMEILQIECIIHDLLYICLQCILLSDFEFKTENYAPKK